MLDFKILNVFFYFVNLDVVKIRKSKFLKRNYGKNIEQELENLIEEII